MSISPPGHSRRPTRARRVWALAAARLVLLAGSDLRPWPLANQPAVIGGPLAFLLAGSTDLGPATGQVRVTAALNDTRRPETLMAWASSNGLSVRWRPGDNWAVIEGAPTAVADTFGVSVHNYRGRRGQVFYASPQQPCAPAAGSFPPHPPSTHPCPRRGRAKSVGWPPSSPTRRITWRARRWRRGER